MTTPHWFRTFWNEKNSSQRIIVWVSLVVCLSFIHTHIPAIILPFLYIIVFWPYRIVLMRWIGANRYTILYQILIGYGYFFYHLKDILQLELWSDEIFSLTIAAHPFEQIAKTALKLSVIPPLHYWELWSWKHVVDMFPISFMEFTYRIPMMTYHIFASILFAGLVTHTMRKESKVGIFFVNFFAFAGFYFNPLLHPFAVEVRPYASMVFGSVITLIALETNEIYTIRYVPVQLVLFIQSFFFAFAYIPVAISQLFSSYRKTFIATFLGVYVLYSAYIPFARIPDQTIQSTINFAISRTIREVAQVFVPTIVQQFFFIGVLIYMLFKKKRIFFLFQIFCIWFSTISLGYIIRYQAFAPRHLIISFPILIYILFIPLFDTKKIYKYIFIILFSVVFTYPWIIRTEKLYSTQSFAPKISIGIKKSLEKSARQKLPLAFDTTTSEPKELQHVYHYFEEVSLWYIYAYTKKTPARFSAQTFCSTQAKYSYYFISYHDEPCIVESDNASILQFKIHE